MTVCFRIVFVFKLLVLLLITAVSAQQPHFVNPGPVVSKLTHLDGHSLKHINTIIEDKSGYLWFGSDDGLMRFDGFSIKKYPYSMTKNQQDLPHKVVKRLLCDEQGNIWIVTAGGGLSRFSPVSESFIHFVAVTDDETSLDSNYLNDIIAAGDGKFWIASNKGINLFDSKTFKNQPMNQAFELDKLANVNVTNLALDSQGRLWFSVHRQGLFRHDFSRQTTVMFKSDKNNPNTVESNFIGKILLTRSGDIWVGTSNAINRFDNSSQTFKRFALPLRIDNKRGRASVMSMYEDTQGRIWVGSYLNGVNVLLPGARSVISVNNHGVQTQALSAATTFDIFQDNSSAIWFATKSQGLLKLNPQSMFFEHRLSQPNKPLNISVLYTDQKGRIWMGANHNLYQWQPNSESFRLMVAGSGLISAMDEDAQGRLVMTISRRGIYIYDAQTEKLIPHAANDEKLANAPGSNIRSLKIANNGWLWLGMSHFSKRISGGLYSFNPTANRYARYLDKYTVDAILVFDNQVIIGTRDNGLKVLNLKTQQVTSIVAKDFDAKRIWDLHQDKQDRVWVAANSYGLAQLNLADLSLDFVTQAQGMDITSILSISEDIDGTLWLGSDKGVVKYHPQQGANDKDSITVYDRDNGLRVDSVMRQGSTVSNGELFFAEDYALVRFRAENMTKTQSLSNASRTPAKVLLTDFRLHSRQQTEDKTQFDNPIEHAKHLNLSYNDYLFSLSFASSDYLLPQKVRYAYIMEGYTADWIETEHRNATFTSMPAGRYVFKVKSTDSQGNWYNNQRELIVTIAPPWWQTWQAYLSFLLGGLLAIFAFIRYRTQKLLAQAKILENKVSQRTQQLQQSRDQVTELLAQKQKMFANISHEFKTPLTLILSPLETILNAHQSQGFSDKLMMMKRNGNRLLRMIEQLLDLARLESGQRQISKYYSVEHTLQILLTSFQPLFDSKNLKVQCEVVDDGIVYLKVDALEMILTNLLSNAIKYTPIDGQIDIQVKLESKDVVITVIDSGVGIVKQNMDLVFNRFTRANEFHDEAVPGAGIGLALVKELVESHRGSISLQSELGHGSCFTVTLPSFTDKAPSVENVLGVSYSTKHEVAALMSQATVAEIEQNVVDINSQPQSEQQYQHKPQLLLIDDNQDMLAFLADTLKDDYHCIVAQNGQQGLDLAKEQIPDLIITDVMMPGISGFDVAKSLKDDELTCHIPVVLLTAKGDVQSRMQGWQQDIDDYLTKPFHPEELLLRVQSLLSIRRILKKRFVREHEKPYEIPAAQNSGLAPLDSVDSADAVISIKDSEFLQRFKQVIADNYQDENFNRVQAAEQLFISDRQLSRKLSALLEDNFSEYLRRHRLQVSLTLFESGKQVNEISDEVGFSSSAYFIRCFKAEFGQTPKQYQKQVVL